MEKKLQFYLRNLIRNEDNLKGRWRKYTYEEILLRDNTNLDIIWLKDNNLIDVENLPEPDIMSIEYQDKKTSYSMASCGFGVDSKLYVSPVGCIKRPCIEIKQ